jgi:hypothetical protein
MVFVVNKIVFIEEAPYVFRMIKFIKGVDLSYSVRPFLGAICDGKK